jgi:hypothetical protein
MKMFGCSAINHARGSVTPEALAEVRLVAEPQELRAIAAFLQNAAAERERVGQGLGISTWSTWWKASNMRLS